jgi:hypothetical protein
MQAAARPEEKPGNQVQPGDDAGRGTALARGGLATFAVSFPFLSGSVVTSRHA